MKTPNRTAPARGSGGGRQRAVRFGRSNASQARRTSSSAGAERPERRAASAHSASRHAAAFGSRSGRGPDGARGGVQAGVGTEVGVEAAVLASQAYRPVLAPEQESRGSIARAFVVRHEAEAGVAAIVFVALHPPGPGQATGGGEALGLGQAGAGRPTSSWTGGG